MRGTLRSNSGLELLRALTARTSKGVGVVALHSVLVVVTPTGRILITPAVRVLLATSASMKVMTVATVLSPSADSVMLSECRPQTSYLETLVMNSLVIRKVTATMREKATTVRGRKRIRLTLPTLVWPALGPNAQLIGRRTNEPVVRTKHVSTRALSVVS